MEASGRWQQSLATPSQRLTPTRSGRQVAAHGRASSRRASFCNLACQTCPDAVDERRRPKGSAGVCGERRKRLDRPWRSSPPCAIPASMWSLLCPVLFLFHLDETCAINVRPALQVGARASHDAPPVLSLYRTCSQPLSDAVPLAEPLQRPRQAAAADRRPAPGVARVRSLLCTREEHAMSVGAPRPATTAQPRHVLPPAKHAAHGTHLHEPPHLAVLGYSNRCVASCGGQRAGRSAAGRAAPARLRRRCQRCYRRRRCLAARAAAAAAARAAAAAAAAAGSGPSLRQREGGTGSSGQRVDGQRVAGDGQGADAVHIGVS